MGLCERKCTKCILNEECGGCSLCEASICNRNCRGCFCLCPRRPCSLQHVLNMGGPQISINKNADIELTSHIPILPDRLQITPNYTIAPIIGVHAGNMFSNNGEKVSKNYLQKGFRGALNVDKFCEGILEFYIKDRQLEGFWDKRMSIYKDIKDMGFKAVIAPNFSVYSDTPRIDHLYNIKRSSIVYNELLEQGINSIPDISWYNDQDLKRWYTAINEHNIGIISFSFQTVDVRLKASNFWKEYLTGFRYLCSNISSKTKIIVAGMSSHRRIEEIHKAAFGQRIYVLNQSAYVQSRRGMLSKNRVRDVKTPVNIMLEKNIEYFNKIYKEMNDMYVEWEEF